jgi:hypothetical protein
LAQALFKRRDQIFICHNSILDFRLTLRPG